MLLLARFVVWTCVLEVVWMVLVGTTQSTELVAGGIASAITALFVERLRRLDLFGFAPSLRIVARAWSIPYQVVFDFVLVAWILLRSLTHGQRVRGEWVRIDYPMQPGRVGRFQRALAATLENETANGMVVDLDRDTALLHSLDTSVSSGRTVL